MKKSVTNIADDLGATAVITHRVRSDKRAEYEQWLEEISSLCKAMPGYLDWHIIRPIPELTETYTIVIRFESVEKLRIWMESSERARLIESAQPLFVTADDFYISSGLDFWFTPPGAKAKLPVRWKQYLVTWSAIYPLAVGVPMIIVPVLTKLGIIAPTLTTLVVTGVVVFLMVYVIMPRYTRLVQQWLFR